MALFPVLMRFSNNPQLHSSIGCLNTIQQLRYRKRKPNEKLEKPEDKSKVILGKVKPIIEKKVIGVSDKQYPIHMNWKKPVRIETVNPAISGDIGGLEHFGEVDLSQPPVHLEGSQELESAEDEVKRILSLEFARRNDVMNKLKKTVVKDYQRHKLDGKLDVNSDEVHIALLTIKIRNLQHYLINLWPYKNQPVKNKLTYLIASRRKILNSLREEDYKKYEWILEKLNLFYKPVPKYDHLEISRRASIERLTDIWCQELKQNRLDKYKRKLEEEQPKFLRNKAAKLQHIMQEEKDLGLEATVKQEEIDECLRRAEEIEANNLSKEQENENFLVYKEEVVEDKNFLN